MNLKHTPESLVNVISEKITAAHEAGKSHIVLPSTEYRWLNDEELRAKVIAALLEQGATSRWLVPAYSPGHLEVEWS